MNVVNNHRISKHEEWESSVINNWNFVGNSANNTKWEKQKWNPFDKIPINTVQKMKHTMTISYEW